MKAHVIELATRRPEPEDEPDEMTLADAGGILGEVRDRIERIEARLARIEKRGRL